MPAKEQKIYESPAPELEDDFWLEHGKKMLEESLPTTREAAKSLMTGLGLLQAFYLGILGFSEYIPKTISVTQKTFFLGPLVFWLVALYFSIEAIIPQRLAINLHSPDDIREKSQSQLRAKQRSLQLAFWLLAAGLVTALLLLVYRLKLGA
jgi:hypothetical protein